MSSEACGSCGESDLDDPLDLFAVQLSVSVLVVHLKGPFESVLQVPPQNEVQRRNVL